MKETSSLLVPSAGKVCGLDLLPFCLLLVLCMLMAMNAEAADSKTGSGASAKGLATFGGGCFWCVEAVYEQLDGVKSVTSGYAGGRTPNPSYEEVCTGRTGHAEVVQVAFDPERINYERILEIFWKAHDPTTLNRQGADRGTQYRSIILYHDEDQKAAAEKSKQEAAKNFKDPIVTEIAALAEFYPAEEYHQDYYKKNPNAPYCAVVIEPKLKKLEELWR